MAVTNLESKILWNQDLDTSEITSGLIMGIVERIPNQNSRKRLFITARSIFKDLGVCQDLPYLEGSGKIYDIPSQAWIERNYHFSKLIIDKVNYASRRIAKKMGLEDRELLEIFTAIRQARNVF